MRCCDEHTPPVTRSGKKLMALVQLSSVQNADSLKLAGASSRPSIAYVVFAVAFLTVHTAAPAMQRPVRRRHGTACGA